MTGRQLTPSEIAILEMVDHIYGQQRRETVTIMNNEAWIFARNVAGVRVIAINLTNLGAWRDEGTLTDEELRKHWLVPLP